jgi:integrase
MGVKEGHINSKRYGAKVKLYYPKDHAQTKEIIFYVTFKINGKKHLKPVGKKSNGWTEKRAFEQRAKLMDKSKFGTGVHNDSVTVGELAVEYFEWAEVHNRSWKKTYQKYNKHISYLDNVVVMSLKDRDVTKLQKELKSKGLSNSYVNDVVGILTAIVSAGVRNGAIEYSPFKNLIKLKEKDKKDRFLSEEEICRLLEEVKDNGMMYRFVLIALHTGLRAGAILETKKRDLDFKDDFFRVEDIKRTQSYLLPLSPELKKYFIDYDEEYLVGGQLLVKYGTFRKKFKPVLDRLFNVGLDTYHKDKVSMHTLRHTFASNMTRLGMNSLMLQKYLNHADGKMTAHYSHLNDDSGREYFNMNYIKKVSSDSEI